MLKINKQQLTEDVSFSNEVIDLINEKDWANAYKNISSPEGHVQLIDEFLKEYPAFKNIQNKIDVIKEPLIREIQQLKAEGFYAETNPILELLKNYLVDRDGEMSADAFRDINNMWSKGVVSDETVRNNNDENNILLNKDLYNKDDKEFIVKAFNWLSDSRNIVNNFQVDGDYGIAKNYFNKEDNLSDDDYRYIRNSLIFNNADATKEIKDVQEIKNNIADLESKFSKDKDTEDNTEVNIKPEEYTKQEVDNILKAGVDNISQNDVNKLFNYFKDKGWLQ